MATEAKIAIAAMLRPSAHPGQIVERDLAPAARLFENGEAPQGEGCIVAPQWQIELTIQLGLPPAKVGEAIVPEPVGRRQAGVEVVAPGQADLVVAPDGQPCRRAATAAQFTTFHHAPR